MNEKRPNSNTYWVHDKLLAGEYPGHWETQVAQHGSQLAGNAQVRKWGNTFAQVSYSWRPPATSR